jgi:large subunit ribosomal protein L25
MAEITLAAEAGRPTGSRASGRLRATGRVPGVVYGLDKPSVPVSVVWKDLRQALVGEAGMNALIDLQVDGGSELVMVWELQRHPVRRDVLHVDFLRIDPHREISVDVPIVLAGEAHDVTAAGGSVDHVLHHVTVQAKPDAIPNELTLDISGLAMGSTLRVADLDLPEGVSTHIDPEEPIVTTSVAAAEEAPAAEEGAEEAAAAGEGEAAAGEGGSSGGAESGGSDSGE